VSVDARVLAVLVARRSRIRRAELGMTQGDLAARMGWEREHVSRLERAKHKPSLRTLIALATALRTSVDWLAAPPTVAAPAA